MDDIRRVAVGSTNRVKVMAVSNVIARFWPKASVLPVEASSGVGEQPMSDERTMAGALNRARAALERAKADLAFGLEGGAMEMGGRIYLCNWAAAIDAHGTVGYGSSTRLELPPSIAAQLRQGRELGPLMDSFTGIADTKRKNGAIGVFTNDYVKRQESFEHAALYSLARFLHPEWYNL